MNIATQALREHIAAHAAELHALRKLLSTTWARPMADEQRKQRRLRRRVTELHVLYAWLRGKQHTRNDSRWRPERLVEDYRAQEMAS